MLFHSSLRKELARQFGATLVVLVTVVMTMMLIRTLGYATKGGVNPQEVTLVMAYLVLSHMPTILTLSLFIAIVGTLTRLYSDSEMVIWFASGAGLGRFVQPLMQFAWPVLLGIAVLALAAWPWANRQLHDLSDRYERRGDLERISPGEFQTSANGDRVFFIDKDSVPGQGGRNIFIASHEGQRQTVTTAQSGRIENVKNQKLLTLQVGQQLEIDDKTAEIKISDFDRYSIQVGQSSANNHDELPVEAQDSLSLLQSNQARHWGELIWRVGFALAAVNLVVLALILSHANPRSGRSANLLIAFLAFVVYYNLVNLGKNWVSSGVIGPVNYLLVLHGGGLCLNLLWLNLRHKGRGWNHLPMLIKRKWPMGFNKSGS